MFEEVIDTSILKITVSKHMFLRKQQLKTTKWYAELLLTCWWYANFFWIIWWYAVEKRLGTTDNTSSLEFSGISAEIKLAVQKRCSLTNLLL
jgi:IS4 transposase